MKKWLVGTFVVTLAGCSSLPSDLSSVPEGVTLVDYVAPESGKLVIPYSKYQLDNGLTVILSPDKSDPLVHVDVTYHVGSAREEIGKSGFAHFFEHMMFQGSENVVDQEHFRLVTEAGGSLNGTTNRDRTNYFETVPANQLEKMLWLESDRMGFLLDAVSQKKFEIQRSTVKNERAQRYDNRPYGLVYERIGEALYPQDHPYSWQTIGYVEDLDRVDVNDLKAFFLRWYGPNNAVITIGGDIDTKQTLEWVNKYFGSIPRGPEVVDAPKQPVTLDDNRYLTLEDNIRQPMLMMAFPTTHLGEKDEASLDMLAKLIGGGKTSLLYNKLVKTGKVVDAGAFHDCGEIACTLYVYAMAESGENGDLQPVYQQVMEVLDQFEQKGVTQRELEEIQGIAEASAIFGLQSVKGKVSQLASYETFYGNPNRLGKELEQLRNVTASDIMKAYKTFLNGHNKVALSVVPKGQTELAAYPDNFTPPPRQLPDYQKISEEQLVVRKALDTFDRSVMPLPSAPVEATMPEIYQTTLDSGINVLGTVATETPTIELQFLLPAGNRYVEPGKEGLAGLTAAMLKEGTTSRSAEEIQQALDTLGSTVRVSAGGYTTNVSVTSLTKNIDATLAIAKEVLFQPAFNQSDFDRLKKQALEGVIYEHQKPSWLASQATRQVLFDGSLFSRASDGTTTSLESLTLDDVKAFYREHYTPKGADLIAVGDISQKQLVKKLKPLSEWTGPEPKMLSPQLLPELDKQSIYLVDKPNAPQSVVRLIRQGLDYDATGELYKTQLANFNLAGNFNSRINLNLREDKGYTYGAGGYLLGTKEVGMIAFYAQVRANATTASIKEFLSELESYSTEGITEKELDFMRLAVGQKDALSYETPGKKASLLAKMLTYSLDNDFIEQRNDIAATISQAELNKLAAKWFNPSQYQIVVVGDAAKLRPELEQLGLPIEALQVQQ